MYQTLYRKWRPQTFDDVCGQEHISSILRYQIETGKTSHAYLFCGSRGTGKTTCAKLLARALNCENPQNGNPCGVCAACRGILSGQITDVIEMDAASNNGVDNIRDIREDVAYAPSECKKRVFIIDEVHMLSTSAFNALLKTLEEPPPHIVFILATTEMHKIPATILSRCQRYDFRRIDASVIAARLRTIADAEGIAIEDGALSLLARLANGGMRDAIGMLELCAGDGGDGTPITASRAAVLVGTSPVETTAAVVEALQKRDYGGLFASVDALYRDARDIGVFWQSLIGFYRDMLVAKTVPEPASYLELPPTGEHSPLTLARGISLETLLCHTRILDEVYTTLQKNTAPARLTVEMGLVRMCDAALDTGYPALLARIAALEDRVALGALAPTAASAPTADASVGQTIREAHPTPVIAPTPPTPPAVFQAAPPADANDFGMPEPPPVHIADTDAPPSQAGARSHAAPSVTPPPPASAETEKEKGRDREKKKTLRALRSWQEAVKRVEKQAPAVSSFLHDSRAYTCEDDGKLYIRVPGVFAAQLIRSQAGVLALLCQSVSVTSGVTYRESDIVLQTPDKVQNEGYETIDELIEAAGGDEA